MADGLAVVPQVHPGIDAALRATRFVVFDFEALVRADVDPAPTDLGAVEVSLEAGISRRFSQLIRPRADVSFSPFDISLTGIRPEDVASAPSPESVMADFDAWIGGAPFVAVAHNAMFDLGVARPFAAHCPRLFAAPCVCTVALGRAAVPGWPSYALDAVTQRLGIRFRGRRHRALPDAEATAEALLRFLEIAAQERGRVLHAEMMDWGAVALPEAEAPRLL